MSGFPWFFSNCLPTCFQLSPDLSAFDSSLASYLSPCFLFLVVSFLLPLLVSLPVSVLVSLLVSLVSLLVSLPLRFSILVSGLVAVLVSRVVSGVVSLFVALLVFLLVLLLPCLDPGCCAKIIVKQFDFWYILWSMALWTGTPIWNHRAHITSVIFTPSSVISLFCLIPDIVLAF